ncbi:polysaccharide deacetylase family protein [Nonomuraea sp. NPDC048916]|uniref:polysaccharide deacetylase family protein n=1 Tax=Nonomuraea sp. NPDC048916 TaxID=3154232 RepID=UPI0033DECF72
MRVWGLALALVAMVGTACSTRPATRPQMARPPTVVDPRILAKRLAAMQPDWPATRPVNCRREKCVALTFDDGPGDYTAKLLDLLRSRHAKATFFVLGQMVAADPHNLARRIVDEGHEIGNHSWSHPPLTALTDEQIRTELTQTGDLIRRLTGVRMQMMRPPYGATDDRVAAETRREGLAQILWSLDTLDWRDRASSVVARRAGLAKPGEIVLMHDIHRTTVEAVPEVLDTLAKKGYRFVTVSELYGGTPVPGRQYTTRWMKRE